MSEENRTCDGCGETSERVFECIDPYVRALDDEEVDVELCPDCYESRRDHI